MEQVLILLVISFGVTQAFFLAAETKCNATSNASLCSAALGGSVYIQVMTNASGHQLQCKKQLPTGPISVFYLKKEKVTIRAAFKNRTEFFINNGTLKITHLERNDSAQYTVEIFDQHGVLVRNIYANLDVQENGLPLWIIICCAVGALLVMVLVCCCCCVYRKVRAS